MPAIRYTDAVLPAGQTLYWIGPEHLSGRYPDPPLPTAIGYAIDGAYFDIATGLRGHEYWATYGPKLDTNWRLERTVEMPDGSVVEIVGRRSLPPSPELLDRIVRDLTPVESSQADIDYYERPE